MIVPARFVSDVRLMLCHAIIRLFAWQKDCRNRDRNAQRIVQSGSLPKSAVSHV